MTLNLLLACHWSDKYALINAEPTRQTNKISQQQTKYFNHPTGVVCYLVLSLSWRALSDTRAPLRGAFVSGSVHKDSVTGKDAARENKTKQWKAKRIQRCPSIVNRLFLPTNERLRYHTDHTLNHCRPPFEPNLSPSRRTFSGSFHYVSRRRAIHVQCIACRNAQSRVSPSAGASIIVLVVWIKYFVGS